MPGFPSILLVYIHTTGGRETMHNVPDPEMLCKSALEAVQSLVNSESMILTI